MAQIKAVLCSACGSSVSMLGSYVRCSSTEYKHLGCYIEPLKNEWWGKGYAQHRTDVEDVRRIESERAAFAQKAKDDAARVQAEALRVVNAENARRIEATRRATDALRLEQQGQATPRFQAISEELEILPPTTTRPVCVRCGSPDTSNDHPRHCSKCWNSPPPDAVSKTPEVKVPVIPFNPRPIEMD